MISKFSPLYILLSSVKSLIILRCVFFSESFSCRKDLVSRVPDPPNPYRYKDDAYDLRAGEVEKRGYTGAHWTASSAELTRSRLMKDLASKTRQRR